MNTTKYNPKFKTIKNCQTILDDVNSSQSDKETAKSRISEIKKWLETKNQTTTQKIDQTFDESINKEIDQEAQLIAIAHRITTQRYPKMSQSDYAFGQIVNATSNRILEIRKVNAIRKIAKKYEVIAN